ncbi:M56 family metallopeptidase [Pedobacter jamesrossensis]|uniref:M56 family metallopeptidase n=1 Tax=Pedobacter jamesrossensis TaxID=1908238 RepID=A0ABV8NKJ2_9SPHI
MEFDLTKFLPSNWLHALGTTLFHSLWLGILLSLLVAIIMFSTRKTAATLRYNLLTGSLLLFVITTAVIFYKSLGNQNLVTSTNVVLVNAKSVAQNSSSALRTNMFSSVNDILNVWNGYASQIVLIWFLIICAKTIQLFVGLNGVYHLRNNKVYAAGSRWDDKINQLAKRIGVTQTVGLLQSGIAQVPMAVGYFKPLVLIPLGLLNGLTDLEVEAILCHELAHIKRRDYLVNLLQSFIEIVFFFNPAILWVSKLIRNERENCCDDLAVLHMDDKRNYVKALITCQEFQLNAPRFAMALTGKKNHLFQRISRMLFDTKTTLNKMEKTILTIALVSVVICSAAFKNVAESNKKQGPIAPLVAQGQNLQDTLKRKAAKQKAKLESNIAKKAKEAEKLSMEQEINLRQEQEANAIKAEIEAKQEDEKYKAAQKKYDAAQKRYDVDQLRYDADRKKYDAHQKRYDIESKKYQAESDKYQKEAKRYDANRNFNYNTFPLAPSVPPTPNTPSAPIAPPTPNVPLSISIKTPISPVTPVAPIIPVTIPGAVGISGELGSTDYRRSNSKTISKTNTKRTTESVTSTDADVHDYKRIIKDMISDGIIKSDKKLSYKLDKNSLIINDVKQNESNHQKYKNKYLRQDNTALLYKFETNSN